MMPTLRVLLLLCALPVALPAQAPAGKQEAPGSRQDRQAEVERLAEHMRRQVEEGRMIRSHVRVTVRLQNGNRLRGVVKDGRLVERVDGLRFVRAAEADAGAGIRLWYSDGGASYVFLPFEQIANYDVHERLTSEQLEAIERDAIAKAQRAAEERAARLQQEQLARAGQEPQPPAGTVGEQGSAPAGEAKETGKVTGAGNAPPPAPGQLSEEQKRLFALLQEYPPKEGWTAAKAEEIKRRRAVLGVNPSEREWRFVQVLADWQRAVEVFGAAAPKPETEPPAPEAGKRRRD